MHARGMCQGNPLSALLFVLSMEVMTLLINRVTEHKLLSLIGNCTATQ
jgi:hypothetical protein